MDYFVWYDGNAQKTSAEKIHDAIAAYQVRFARAPHLVLVHSADQTQVRDMVIRSEQTIQRDNFWLGIEEQTRNGSIVGPALSASPFDRYKIEASI